MVDCTKVDGPRWRGQNVESMAPKPKGKNCGFSGPWAVVGDFNLIYQDQDKNNTNLNRRMMGRFRRVINDLALHELHLNGRSFTWSNGWEDKFYDRGSGHI